MIPQGQLAAVAAKEASQVLVVGFADFRDFNAGILAAGMNRNRSYQWRSVEIDSGCRRPNPNSYDLAVYLDKMWPQVVDRLRPALQPAVQNAKSVAFPAVMGLEKWRFIKQDMEECLGVPVFEVPTLPPSVPGVRLGGVLKKRVCQLNGEMLAGFPVRETIMNGQTCDAVVIDTPGRPRLLEGGKFILATGGIMGGGIVMGRERPAETVFGFPVEVPENSVDGRFFAPNGHGYARCGVRVNERLQPLDVDGQVLVDNIFCAGRILAGYDPFVEKDGAGVAIASGHKAALEALRR
jgi:glycerol-3-phosphate dehydrogenase subunit B